MIVPSEDWTPCRTCRSDVVFASTGRIKDGQPVIMPVDVKPSPQGNVALGKDRKGYHATVPNRNQRAGMIERGEQLHTSHFATCADAVRFRKVR